MITKLKQPTHFAGIMAASLVVILSGALLAQANRDSKEVEQTLTDMLIPLAQKDLDRWAEYYVQDDSFSTVILRGVYLVGFQNYKRYLRKWLETASMEQHTFSNIEVHLLGEVALATVRDNCVIKYIDGNPDRVIRGIGTFILVKRDGRWFINHYHVTDPNDNSASVFVQGNGIVQ